MSTTQHSTLTGSSLHEPKGVAAAAVNKVYVSDGAASGSWKKLTIGTEVTALTATDPLYGPKAWAKCSISGGVLTQDAGYNCTVTRDGGGTYTCTFTSAMADANYAVVGCCLATSNIFMVNSTYTPTTAAFHIYVRVISGGSGDPPAFYFAVFGN